MENLLKLAMDRRGLTPIEASRLGVPYHRIFKQYKGERRVSLRSALLYEKVLGIPVTELLPESSPSHTDPPEEKEPQHTQPLASDEDSKKLLEDGNK